MNRTLKRTFLIATPIAAISLSGCAYSSHDYPYANPYNVAYATPAYYDGYYGPYHDGYWGPDGFFNYYDARVNNFVRDDGRHFQRQASPGFRQVQTRNDVGRTMRLAPPPHASERDEHGGGDERASR